MTRDQWPASRFSRRSRSFSERIARAPARIKGRGAERISFGAADATRDRRGMQDRAPSWPRCSVTVQTLRQSTERRRNLFRLVFLFHVFLGYSPATAIGRRWWRSCTLERRPGDDCCHHRDPRPRGPSRCHTPTRLSRLRRRNYARLASERACRRARTIMNRLLIPSNETFQLYCRRTFWNFVRRIGELENWRLKETLIVRLIVNLKTSYVSSLKNAASRWHVFYNWFFLIFLLHMQDYIFDYIFLLIGK